MKSWSFGRMGTALLLTFLGLAAGGCAGIAGKVSSGEVSGRDSFAACMDPEADPGDYEFHPTGIDGLLLVATPDEIFYCFPASGHRLFGELYAPDGSNLTEPLREKRLAARWQEIIASLEPAVIAGSGPIPVFEIIDPASPDSYRMEAFWATRPDVTRHIYLIDLQGPGPETAWKGEYILAARDRELALRQVIAGRVRPPADGYPADEEAYYAFFRMQDFLVRMGIDSAPHYYIGGEMIRGADEERLREILAAGGSGPAPAQ